jgi:hypothetical protein
MMRVEGRRGVEKSEFRGGCLAEAQALRDHYRGQDGGTRSFMLPNAIWAGHSSPANIVPLGTTWVYAAQTEEVHLSGLLFNGSVQLLQVI